VSRLVGKDFCPKTEIISDFLHVEKIFTTGNGTPDGIGHEGEIQDRTISNAEKICHVGKVLRRLKPDLLHRTGINLDPDFRLLLAVSATGEMWRERLPARRSTLRHPAPLTLAPGSAETRCSLPALLAPARSFPPHRSSDISASDPPLEKCRPFHTPANH